MNSDSTSSIFRNLEHSVTYQFEKVAYYEICATGYGCANYPDGVFTKFASGMTNQPPTLAGGGLDTLWIDFTEAQSTFTLNSLFNVNDPDDNPLFSSLTYTATSGDPSILGVSVEFIPGFLAVPGVAVPGFWNVTFAPKRPGSATVTYVVQDGYGGSLTVSHTVVFNSLRRSVVENSNAGVNVGLPVSGPAVPEGSVTLTGVAAGTFAINAESGQITVKEGANLDYESIDSYAGTLNYLTVGGVVSTVGLTIYVTDAPTMAAPTVSKHWFGYSEFPSRPAMDVSWTAPADFTVTGYDLRYSFCSDCPGYEGFIYHSNKKTSETIWNRLNGEKLPKGTIFKVQIRALGADGATDWAYGPDNARTNSAPAPRVRQVTLLPHTNHYLTDITADRAARHTIGQTSINAIFRDDDGDLPDFLASLVGHSQA